MNGARQFTDEDMQAIRRVLDDLARMLCKRIGVSWDEMVVGVGLPDHLIAWVLDGEA